MASVRIIYLDGCLSGVVVIVAAEVQAVLTILNGDALLADCARSLPTGLRAAPRAVPYEGNAFDVVPDEELAGVVDCTFPASAVRSVPLLGGAFVSKMSLSLRAFAQAALHTATWAFKRLIALFTRGGQTRQIMAVEGHGYAQNRRHTT